MLSKLKFFIGWPLSVLALLFVFKIVFENATKAIHATSGINFLFLFLSIILFVLFFFLKAYLWKLLLGKKGNLFTFKKNALYLATSELKRYVPGNIWAFMSRTAVFEKNDLSKKEIVSFIAKEIVILSVSSLLLSLFYISAYVNNEYIRYTVLIFALVISLVFVFHKILGKVFPSIILKIFYFFVPNYSAFENLTILLWGILTFFIFGLGTYFSIISILYLDLRQILIFISIFNLSFFIGYVSLITPMGLGIREGTMTLTLTQFIGASAAAISSIFSRVIFIVSEMIALGLIVLWNKINFEFIKRVEKFVSENKYLISLIIFVFIYIGYYTTASFLRYDNFYTGRFDLGNMDQTVWNSINGRMFQLTNPDGTETVSRLSFHSDFILVLLSPLYLIWESPKMLLLLQTTVLGVGAFFVFFISKNLLKKNSISLIFSAAYLLNPAVGFVNLYDFHPVALATMFLLGAYYYFLKKNYILFTILLLLAAITKEEVWALISIFGLFIIARAFLEKNRKNLFEKVFGFSLVISGIPIAYILIDKVIPYFRGSDHFALEYYSDFGNSTSDVLKNILLNPFKLISRLFEGNRLEFLNQLFLPLGFLSLFSPFILIFILPDLIISLLSSNVALHQIYYQYTSVITPFVFIAAIYSVKLLLNKFKKLDIKIISVYLIFFALFAQYLTGPLPASKKPNIDMFIKPLENKQQIENFLSSIPKKYSIAATNNAGSHLSQREHIYTLPIGIDKADYVIFLIDHGWTAQSLEEQAATINKLKISRNFELVFQTKNFFAFKRIN